MKKGETTVLSMLEKVPDYRKGNGVRHKLVDILMIGLLTFICNGNDYAAMRTFGKMHEELLTTFLELPKGIPSVDTFERVFQKINPKYLSVAFKDWTDELKEAIRQSKGIAVSIDGKTICGSKRMGKKAVHVVSAFASELRLVLGEMTTDKKSNEITAIPELLEMFCQKGMIITIDAMGCQKEIAKKIIKKKGDYVLAVKRNQETLFLDIEVLADYELIPNKDELRRNGQYDRTIEKDHGRIETRECYISTNIEWLSTVSEWKGISGFGVIISKREVIGKEPTINRHYFIFSLKNTTASEIENNLYWALDVTFKEDSSRAMLGNSAENLNILRKQALRLMDQDVSLKASRRNKRLACAWDISYAFKVIGVN